MPVRDLAFELKETGLAFRDVVAGDDVDAFAVDAAGRAVALELKRVSAVKHDDVLGWLARGVLALQRHRDKVQVLSISAPALTRGLCTKVATFMRRHAPDVQWLLRGDTGDLAVHAPLYGVERVTLGRRRGLHPSPKRTHPFSDLNAAMLKVLLLHDVDAHLWSGARGRPRNAAALAALAGVSAPHAYRFVRLFEELGFLRRANDELVVVRPAALMTLWFDATRLQPPQPIPVRSILGRPTRLVDVFGHDVSVAVTGFEACRRLGVLHTDAGVPVVRTTHTMSDVSGRFDLEACDARDAHFFVLPATSATILRDGIDSTDDVRCVDVVQAALDVVAHPARGLEQAEHIVDTVLELS